MSEILNYDFIPSQVQPIRASQDVASFQRDFSADLYSRPLINAGPPAAGRVIPQQRFELAPSDRSNYERPQLQSQPQPVLSPYGLNQQVSSAPTIAVPAWQPIRGTSAPQQQQITPRANEKIGSFQSTDYETAYKIRQVELNLLDFKGAIERRFTEIQTDLPARLSREISALESRESQLAKDIAEKLAQFQDQHIRARDSLRSNQGSLADQAQKAEVKISEIDYRISQLTKQNEVQSVILERLTSQMPAGPQSSKGSSDQEVQITMLRDQLSQQQRRFELVAQESQRQSQVFAEQIHRIESDMVSRLKEQREANLQVINLAGDQKLKEFSLANGQSDENNQIIRQVLTQIERKVEEDQLLRQTEQSEIKNQVEQRLLNLVDKLKQDERLGLERERRLMEQVQEGLQTMNEIIRSTKEHGQVALSQQTQVLGEQLGSHNQTIDEIKNYVFGRQDVLEIELGDTKQRLIDLEEATLKHVTNVNTVVESEMRRFDNVVSALEKQQLALSEDLRNKLTDFKSENTKWRVDYEDITAKKITEIHQALKVINNQCKKNTEEIKDVKDAFQIEMKLVENNFQAKVAEVKKSIENTDQIMDEKIIAQMGRQREKLDTLVQDGLRDLTVKMNENVETIELKFKLQFDKVKVYIDETQKNTLQQMIEQNLKTDTILEGRCQQYTVGSETKLIERINVLTGKFDGLKDMVSKQKAQPEIAVVRKDDQVALVKDQGEREAALKEWCVKQLQNSYNDFEQLLNAKYNELLMHIEASKGDVLEKFVQEGGQTQSEQLDLKQYATKVQVKHLEDMIHQLEGRQGADASKMKTLQPTGNQLDQSLGYNSLQESPQRPSPQKASAQNQAQSQKVAAPNQALQSPMKSQQSYGYSQENFEEGSPDPKVVRQSVTQLNKYDSQQSLGMKSNEKTVNKSQKAQQNIGKDGSTIKVGTNSVGQSKPSVSNPHINIQQSPEEGSQGFYKD